MRQLLLDRPRPPAVGPLARARAFFVRSWPGRVVAAAFLLRLLDGLLSLLGLSLPDLVGVPARIVLWLFAVWLAWRAFRWVSNRLLWRIRTKLIVSYLFIALVPVVLLTLFMAVAGVLLLGLTASRLVTGEIDRTADVLQATARSAVAGLPAADADAARALPARLAPAREAHPALAFSLLRRGRVVAASGAAPRALPSWWKGPGFAGLVRLDPGDRLSPDALRAAWADGEDVLFLEAPADAAFYGGLERGTGIHVLLRSEMRVEPVESVDERKGGSRVRRGSGVAFEEGGQRVSARPDSAFVFVALPEKTNWETGERSAFEGMPLAFQYEPRALVRRLSPIQVPRDTRGRSVPEYLMYALGVLGLVFVVVYAVALGLGLRPRPVDHPRRPRPLGGDREAPAGRLRPPDPHPLARPARGSRRVLQPHVAGDPAAHAGAGGQGAARGGAAHRAADPDEPAARPGFRHPVRGAGGRPLPPRGRGGGRLLRPPAPLGDTRMGVLVADVSGKGTSAALYMAELKGLVLSLSRIYDSPARLLVEANRILAANMDSRSFVTMTYAVVDTADRRMRYARAGHNPIIQLEAASGTTRVLAPQGLGLGIDRGERFEEILEEDDGAAASKGDIFLFFTDGLSEAMNPGAELFGEGRLRRILEESGTLTSEEIKERILERDPALRGRRPSARRHDARGAEGRA